MKRIILTVLGFVVCSSTLLARETISSTGGRPVSGGFSNPYARTSAGCNPATARVNLEINNVRALILNGGDMWWDQGGSSAARYEVPKVDDPTQPKKHSLYAGSVWIGGRSQGQLKVSAQTYRQSNGLAVGFWPGPLDTVTANIDPSQCAKFDRHFVVFKRDIDKHKANTVSPDPDYVMPSVFSDWPALGDPSYNQTTYLAPFIDVDNNGTYEPNNGDYPDIRGDQAIWWVVNDKGNVPGSSGDPKTAIGVEIQSLAFSYQRNDELNNMTFYRNKISNRSSFTLDSCFMAQWADPDLGQANDDYVGCDVPRGLGICYNSDDNDEGITGYGANPPSVGIDFFEGPYSDPNDGIDNDRDCLIDEIETDCYGPGKTEKLIMSYFMYFTNGVAFPLTDPNNYVQAYNFLTARWGDANPLTYGGNGYGGTQTSKMAFPGLSDQQYGWSAGGNCQSPVLGLPEWSERTAGNQGGDRRFLQSGGPFTLSPGAVNYITIGVVWARASSGGAQGSFGLLLEADTKAQALFESCFRALQGPDNPDMEVVELSNELILNLSYNPASNNYKLRYKESDPILVKLAQTDPSVKDTTYAFQGFKIYQLENSTVSLGELRDLSKARLIAQCDLKDNVKRLINYSRDPETEQIVPRLEVDGADAGIQMSFHITKDAFAQQGDQLINHRPYYFIAVAYAYNEYKPYDIATGTGQAKPYLEGGNSIIKMAIPHRTEASYDGLFLNSKYGDGPEIKRIDGIGNGGNILEFTDATIQQILSDTGSQALFPVYKGGFGPVNIKVNNPKLVPADDFVLGMYRSTPTSGLSISPDSASIVNSRWYLVMKSTNDTIWSDTTYNAPNEQNAIIEKRATNGSITFNKLGLSLSVLYRPNPGSDQAGGNGTISSSMVPDFNSGARWLDFLRDSDVPDAFTNWIAAGPTSEAGNVSGDLNEFYEKVLSGTFTPYRFARAGENFPGYDDVPATLGNNLADAGSIDLVITADTTKWTRGVVLEMGSIASQNEGAQRKNLVRKGESRYKNGSPLGTGELGRGWFPGYAIDLETGERLNIAFGENSDLAIQQGGINKDMQWNPNAAVGGDQNIGEPAIVWGGMHYIYVMKSKYDEGRSALNALTTPSIDNPGNVALRSFYRDVMWVSMPRLLSPGSKLLGTDVTIKIRQTRAYGKFKTRLTGSPNDDNPLYEFNTNNLSPIKSDTKVAENEIGNIRVVPNPYYAFNVYENSQLDNKVKIINLPRKCTIKIYSTSGTLIRTLTKDSEDTWVVWDLKNQARIPIASGMYMVHVTSQFGEKIVKWFGALRPTDLDTF